VEHHGQPAIVHHGRERLPVKLDDQISASRGWSIVCSRKLGKTKMSEAKRASTTFWTWPILLSIPLPAMLNNLYHLPTKAFLSLALFITGTGILLSGVPGILRWFDASPRAEANPGKDTDGTNELQRAIVGPFTLLGALIAGLGGALLVVPDDARATNVTWAVFALLMLGAAGTIMVRALHVFSFRPKNE
jgi:hypothetical protein